MKRRLTRSDRLFLGFCLATLVGTLTVAATPCTFTGTGYWNDPLRWDNVPSDGDTVVIDGTVTLTNSTPLLNSCTLNTARRLVFEGTNTLLRANTVDIYGTVTHTNNTASAAVDGVWIMDHRVYIDATADVTVHTAGSINVQGCGYQGAPTGVSYGYGPGGGNYMGGGGYGGNGGNPSLALAKGFAYGSLTAPEEPGSGGGREGGNGMPGGGAVRIAAGGQVTVNGTINANGISCNVNCGAGSGGAVFIACGTFDGRGTLSAAGGSMGMDTSWRASGGGGRIAVVYTNATAQALLTPTVNFNLGGRMGISDGYHVGELGTLYLPDTNFFPRAELTGGGRFSIPGFTNWQVDHLTIGTSSIEFPAGFNLTVDNAITLTNAAELIFSNATVRCGSLAVRLNNATLQLNNHTQFTVDNDLMVTNKGMVRLSCGLPDAEWTNEAIRVQVGGDLIVAPGGLLHPWSHPTNGGYASFEVNRLLVNAGGLINADGKGFVGIHQAKGLGPGGGGYESGGGSYGGLGGYGYSAAKAGPLYGFAEAPIDPGSAGGGRSYGAGGSGGGLLRVEAADAVVIDGIISANGNNGGNGSGGGSGGGIYIRSATLAGSGTVRARGGDRYLDGGGGGGRIALVYTNLDAQGELSPQLQFDLKGGLGSIVAQNGRRGTLYLSTTNFFPRETLTGHYYLIVPGFTNWAPNALTITNGSLQMPADFTFDVAGAVTLATNSALELREHSTLNCGSLSVASNCELSLYAGQMPIPDAQPGCLVNVAGELRIATNAILYAYSDVTNGASPRIRSGSFTLAKGGRIDANAKGFAAAVVDYGWGWGPGAASITWGGSYGGRGGAGHYGGNNYLPYGSSNAPAWPGSGAGRGWGYYQGGAGGGLIWIEAVKTASLNGIIEANGANGYLEAGGGAGGGIYLLCRTLEGSGSFVANGGNSGTGATHGGSGGGGRIAIWSQRRDAFSGIALATNGNAYVTHLGQPGTIVWGMLPAPGTIMLVR